MPKTAEARPKVTWRFRPGFAGRRAAATRGAAAWTGLACEGASPINGGREGRDEAEAGEDWWEVGTAVTVRQC
ncbi:hypothetical protein B7486_19015 [cyanobacterium TDX16]|nr:hypothetical protein B7486_19015 [cyanobacterium TDX16]